ncbi:IscS subfamily cysteine desulfurase [Halalkalibacterium ligniniphilum]|uniref:IscS subfamily cysteine desulfurase n=1 Tax=Halalkalibacterium ligniniphilum TaxID=1134413 RepID=UPI00035EE909|nr:IscS subfamily cysteine desulfurase [Halalkalibacterium ligniniphilum]
MIYLDYCATTPMSSSAQSIYTTIASKYYGNASSLHDLGYEAAEIITVSKQTIADRLGLDSTGLYFTGSASEANFLTLTSLAFAYLDKGNHLITSKCEHPSVLSTFTYLEQHGFSVTYLPVNNFGQVTLPTLIDAIQPNTTLVSISHGQSELGTLQPIEEIGSFLSRYGILFHSDCVQTVGKLSVPTTHLASLTFSAHKLYGPKGIAAAYICPGVKWVPFLPGSHHQNGFRHGTLDVPSIASFAGAVDEAIAMKEKQLSLYRQLQQTFLNHLDTSVIVEGHPTERLPNHLGLRIKGLEGQYVLLEANRAGFAISTGTACTSGHQEAPSSLLAIGRTVQEAHEFFRVSFGRDTTVKAVEQFTQFLHSLIERHKSMRQKVGT